MKEESLPVVNRKCMCSVLKKYQTWSMHVKGKKDPRLYRKGSSEATTDILFPSSCNTILHFTLSGGMSNCQMSESRIKPSGRKRTPILDISPTTPKIYQGGTQLLNQNTKQTKELKIQINDIWNTVILFIYSSLHFRKDQIPFKSKQSICTGTARLIVSFSTCRQELNKWKKKKNNHRNCLLPNLPSLVWIFWRKR